MALLITINVKFYFKKNILLSYSRNPYKNKLCISQPHRINYRLSSSFVAFVLTYLICEIYY